MRNLLRNRASTSTPDEYIIYLIMLYAPNIRKFHQFPLAALLSTWLAIYNGSVHPNCISP